MNQWITLIQPLFDAVVRLREALTLVGVRVPDYIVVCGTDRVSMTQRGHL